VTEVFTDIRGEGKALASGLLGFFKIIAQGVMGLLLAFHEFQRAVFQMGEGIARTLREFVEQLIMGYGLLAKVIPAFQDNVKELMEVWKNLRIVEEGYLDLQDKQIEKQT